MTEALTPAGKRLLCKFIEAERNTTNNTIGPRLTEFRTLGGRTFLALRLPAGDGGAKAAGLKLQKDGFAEFGWHTSPISSGARYLAITPKGREAIASCVNHSPILLRDELARLLAERDSLPCDGSGRDPALDDYALSLDEEIAHIRAQLGHTPEPFT